MSPAEVTALLRAFNEWRRGDEDIPQFDPREIGEVIDAAVEMIERLEAAEKERDALRAKIEAMEKQEPVRWFYVTNGEWDCYSRERPPEDACDAGSLMALYALPGAQPAPSVPDGWKIVPVEPTFEMLDKGSDQSYGYVSIALDVWVAMLAAAPETKS